MNQSEQQDQIRTETISTASDMIAEAAALSKRADELRGAAITQLLAQREHAHQEIERLDQHLKAVGYIQHPGELNGNGAKGAAKATPESQPPRNARRRFEGLTLAAVAETLLAESEGGVLHGKHIERLSRAGGFTGGTQNFQNYLPVALKRSGGFENIGKNRWKLNPTIQPQRPER